MLKMLDIAFKDLCQLLRDRKTFLFALFMPAVFTLLLGYAFGGFEPPGDDRLPVGWLDPGGGPISEELWAILDQSELIRLIIASPDEAKLSEQVGAGAFAAAVIVPAEFEHHLKEGKPVRLRVILDANTPAGTSVESEILSAVVRLEGAVRAAAILEGLTGAPFDYTYKQILAEWEHPPLRSEFTASQVIPAANQSSGLAHTSPGMMLQFAIAGLLVSGQLMVSERRSQCLKRLLTTSVRRSEVLLGHFLAIFILTMLQFTLLIAYGHFLLKVPYLRAPVATFLVAFAAAACIAGLGSLIGVLARTEEQAVVFALVPMFVLVGIGGGWMPLDVVGEPLQSIGHLSPVAWGMDGFKNVVIRGQGVKEVLLPAAALLGYAFVFLLLAAVRFRRIEEKS